jgi:hypothetical protein
MRMVDEYVAVYERLIDATADMSGRQYGAWEQA